MKGSVASNPIVRAERDIGHHNQPSEKPPDQNASAGHANAKNQGIGERHPQEIARERADYDIAPGGDGLGGQRFEQDAQQRPGDEYADDQKNAELEWQALRHGVTRRAAREEKVAMSDFRWGGPGRLSVGANTVSTIAG